jgi:hypothetical protein
LSVEADVVDISSFAANSSTWMWGWANQTLLPPLRERSRALLGLRDLTGFDLFGHDHAFKIEDEAMAWDLAALSVLHLGALGCYRVPASSGPMASFLAIMSVQTKRI